MDRKCNAATGAIRSRSIALSQLTLGTPARLQTKLTVNTPGDKYEQEADRAAEQVIRMPESQLQRKCSCGSSTTSGECADCKKKKEASGTLQRVASAPVGGMTAPPIVNDVLSSPGSPLPTGTRSFMESRFGRDFSQVRVHTDQRAIESAAAVEARAYTVGSNIVFGHGEHPSKDQRLLAHELTHVLQQGGDWQVDVELHQSPRVLSSMPIATNLATSLSRSPNDSPKSPSTGLRESGMSKSELKKLADTREYFRLPPRPTKSKTAIVGVLIAEDGREFRIHSGVSGGPEGGTQKGHIPRGPGTGMDSFTPKHVEGHAAQIMHQHNIKNATLLLEKPFCRNCDRNITQIIPPDSKLQVVDPESTTHVRSSHSRGRALPQLGNDGGNNGKGQSTRKPTKSASADQPVSKSTTPSGTSPSKASPKTPSASTSVKAVREPPSVKTSAPKTSSPRVRAALKSISSKVDIAGATRFISVAGTILQGVSAILELVKFTGMTRSALAGEGFVLVSQIKTARVVAARADLASREYEVYNRQLSDSSLDMLTVATDGRASGITSIQLFFKAMTLRSHRTEFESHVGKLKAVEHEASAKQKAIENILADPKASGIIAGVTFGTGTLAEMFAVSQDMQTIASEYRSAIRQIEKLIDMMEEDIEFLDSWQKALLQVCRDKGPCDF